MTISAVAAYQEIEIRTMSAGDRIVFLYNHLSGKIRRAANVSDLEQYNDALGNAHDTVTELLVSLDLEAGGEIAKNLASIYGFFLGEITGLIVKRDDSRLQRLASLVVRLAEAWQTANDQIASEFAS
jgi:flagellar secretion chaperone FliS